MGIVSKVTLQITVKYRTALILSDVENRLGMFRIYSGRGEDEKYRSNHPVNERNLMDFSIISLSSDTTFNKIPRARNVGILMVALQASRCFAPDPQRLYLHVNIIYRYDYICISFDINICVCMYVCICYTYYIRWL